MRILLLRRPVWVACLVQGLLVGILTAAVFYVIWGHEEGPLYGIVVGIALTVAVPLVTLRKAQTEKSELLARVGHLSDEDQVIALRAAWGGPLPESPAVRQAALQVALRDAAILGERKPDVTTALFIAASALLALLANPRVWLVTAMLVAALVASVRRDRRLSARLAELQTWAASAGEPQLPR